MPIGLSWNDNPIVGASFGFDSVHSPFNPHFEATELCQIGEGGHLTLKLESGVAISPGAPEIAIFANVSLVDSRYPNGEHKSGTFGDDPVVVDVSEDGISWTSIGSVTCDFPSNGFIDAPSAYHPSAAGLTAADYSKPHPNAVRS